MKKTVYKLLRRGALMTGIILVLCPDCLFAARSKDESDEWRIRENLTTRLGSEWYKIGVLSRELSAIADVLAEIRDLGLFPPELTGLNEESMSQLNTRAMEIEKKYASLLSEVEAFKPPLNDAIEILREMVVGEPVESMFETLEKGDMKRITQMLHVKHNIDSLWNKSDSLLNFVMRKLGLSFKTVSSNGPIEEEFFQILKANLGLQSEQYYQKLNYIKDHLASKSSKDDLFKMYQVEKDRIHKYLLENKLNLAHQKLVILLKRFESGMNVDELYKLLARVHFLKGEYNDVLSIIDKFPESEQAVKTLYRMQSLYALRDYERLWSEGNSIDFSRFSGSRKNLLLWIVLESGLALQKQDNFLKLASLVDKTASYSLHVMHALARSYLQIDDKVTALSIMESTLKYKVNSPEDAFAFREINLAVAQLYYEIGNYKKALSLFYNILNDKKDFDRAMFGILWCYIRLGQDDKAETALRKLINQAPESPLGAEGILILAEKNLYKAGYDWKKIVYLKKEEQRLLQMLDKISRKVAVEKSKENAQKYAYARRELTTLLGRLHQEKWPDYKSINESYDKVKRICDLLGKHYKTGSFQEKAFSHDRERLLHYLDSLILEAKGKHLESVNSLMLSNARQNRNRIKNIVDKAAVLSTVTSIDKFHWEKEYIDWEKALVKQRELKLGEMIAETSDSTLKKSYMEEKQICSSRIDSLLVKEDSISRMHFSKLTEELPAILSTRLDSADESYFRYQLGELYYAEENKKYTADYERYEKDLAEYNSKLDEYREGKLLKPPVAPDQPRLNHDRSIEQFRAVINGYQKSEFIPSAYYSLAWCFNDLSMLDSALYYMENLAALYPTSVHTPQAWMYCGEYNFDRGELDQAIKCYQATMRYPESEWFDEALYKLAWAQYRLSNPEKAISSFLALVSLGESGSAKRPALLEKESMDYIAISFSETDLTGDKGLQRALSFIKKLGDIKKGCQILHRLGTVYRDQGRTDMAKKTLTTLLKTYPNYEKNPVAESDLLAIKEREIGIEETNRIKIDFYRKYNRNSAWAKSQNNEVKEQADSVASKQLYEGAIGFHQYALQKNDSSIYSSALEAYSEFISAYPESPQANECHYNFAEIKFSLGNYAEAAEEYMAVSKRYPDSKYRETAAWNAIVASQNLLKQENAKTH